VLLPLAMYFVPYPHARILLGVVLAWHWWYFLLRVKTLRGEGAQGKGGATAGRLLGFATGARRYVFLNVLARFIGLVFGAFVVFTLADVIARMPVVFLGGDPAVLPALGLCAAAALARALCEFLASKAAFKASAGVKKKLRTALYGKLLSLGGSGISGAEAVQVAVEGVDQIENYFGKYLPQLFYGIVAPLTLFGLLASVRLSVALVLLVCTPLIPLLLLVIMRMAKRMMQKQLKEYGSLGDFFLESLRGMTTLKIFGADARRHVEMNRFAERFRQSTMRVLRMQLNSIVLMDIMAYGSAALGVILAARGFLAGDIELSGAISVILLSAEFFIPLRQLGSYFHIAMNGLSACERVFRILDAPAPEDGTLSLPEGPLDIETEGLSFAYEPGRNALSELSLSAPSPGLRGLAGVSGCGKSTAAKLLSGEMQGKAYGGSVRIGGVELRDLKRSALLERVCLVTHEDYIFGGTAEDNLRAAKRDASEAELEDALKKVRLHDFFEGAAGLATEISEGGANLSGGQRQRLSLARALLRDSDIYIFDEAASNIDRESEEAVLAVIRELAKSKNVLMISHRLASLRPADLIYAMEDGRVEGRGTHEELMAAGGVYARLFLEQRALEAYAAGEAGDGYGAAGAGGPAA
ncbi:MAG: ABC transporter ATP-binding protein/permease, partial [Clostridiales Family XIII bacterium]|jgi:ABC-type transport system involved in cytochrome bd biosynthesis fused ATPase/permease subunit|nr:ABC transporter ATP-binding protein/permease [Clostridiales Family XIII bacterium]